MKLAKVIEQCEEVYKAASSADKVDEKQRAEKQEVIALCEAVRALQKVGSDDVRRRLGEFEAQQTGSQVIMNVGHSSDLLNSFAEDFWSCAFTDLFPRGDCQEKYPKQKYPNIATRSHTQGRKWAKMLLKRDDFLGWGSSKEFAAVAYNIFVRRDQMRSVHCFVTSSALFRGAVEDLASINAKDFLHAAMFAGEVYTVREALRKKKVDVKVKNVLKQMQAATFDVEGTPAFRGSLRFRFVSLRAWNGCSFGFFTLNPHDIRTPLLIAFVHPERAAGIKRVSLDWDDPCMQKYYEDVKKGNSLVLHELAAQNPMATMRCVHLTFRMTIELLFNCTAAANVKSSSQNLDLVPAHCEAGMFNYVSGYLGVVEPQMRFTEHLHLLWQLLGFSHPDDFFRGGEFSDRFRRLWAYAASICFCSQEAFAAQCGTDSGKAALSEAPLMTMNKKQRNMVGHERAEEELDVQRAARNASESEASASSLVKCEFRYWTPAFYGDKNLSAEEWEPLAVSDSNAGSQKFGNHICRDRVCHKNRIGKMGFCRLAFWHWKRVRVKGKYLMMRKHGKRLVRRWQPSENALPPVDEFPPQQGAPALERNHSFHYKETPAVALGARCNHDLGLLCKFPVLSAARRVPADVSQITNASYGGDAVIFDSPEWAESIANMIETMVDHEYYACDYASKEQSGSEGLLHTLHDAKLRHDHFALQRQSANVHNPALDRARKMLQSLVASSARRMHVGFPSVYAYLFGKPIFYSSHEFVNLPVSQVNNVFVASAQSLCLPIHEDFEHDSGQVVRSEEPSAWKSLNHKATGPTNIVYDYDWRADALEECPMYFFAAGTSFATSITDGTWQWHVDVDGNGKVVGRHPCYDYRKDDKRFQKFSKQIKSPHGGFEPLRKHGEIICGYDHYRVLRTTTAWRLPVFKGTLPHKPKDDADAREKGAYAIFMMMLFRPWRKPGDALRMWLGIDPNSTAPFRDMDEIYLALFQEFERWFREDICAVAKPYWSGNVRKCEWPLYSNDGSKQQWWKCLIYDKVRNLEMVLSRRIDLKGKTPTVPAEINGLPVEEDVVQADGSDHDSCNDASDGDGSDVPMKEACDHLGDNESDVDPTAQGIYPSVPTVECIRVPAMLHSHDFFGQAGNAVGRSAEAKYSREFMRVVSERGMDADSMHKKSEVLSVQYFGERWPSGCLADSEVKQTKLFKKLDDCELPGELFKTPEIDATAVVVASFEDQMAASFKQLLEIGRNKAKTPKLVLEAAFFLLQEGLLSIPGSGLINSKQGLALLHVASWIQKKKTQQWRDEGVLLLAQEDLKIQEQFFGDELLMVLSGAAGTGKTTVIRVIEKLFDYFFGDGSFLKSAPTNTASRLLGGDTCFALYKLPLRSLKSKRGKLSAPVMAVLRRRLAPAYGHCIDEMSMLTPQSTHHLDVRTRDGKRRFEERFGGLATLLCGDFLQLPPVRRPSLASPVDDVGHVAQIEGEGDEQDPDANTEHREGYALWREFKTVVVLGLNLRADYRLSRILQEMRDGNLTDASWAALQDRVVGMQRVNGELAALPDGQVDSRLTQAPFSNNDVYYTFHRHSLRVTQAYLLAVHDSIAKRKPLFIIAAADCVRDVDSQRYTDLVKEKILRTSQLRKTGNKPGYIPVYQGLFLLYVDLCLIILNYVSLWKVAR